MSASIFWVFEICAYAWSREVTSGIEIVHGLIVTPQRKVARLIAGEGNLGAEGKHVIGNALIKKCVTARKVRLSGLQQVLKRRQATLEGGFDVINLLTVHGVIPNG
jgi:hypothetical protein